MSKLKVDELDTRSGTTITVAAGKTLAGTDIIGATQIAANAVTTAKILDANVTTDKILDANVTTDKILDANVTTDKILDDNVTYGKLQDTVTANRVLGAVAAGTIGEVEVATDMVADNAVTLAKMADGTQGDTLYYGASGAPTLLAKPGTPAGEVLTFATSATAPSWVAAAGGDLTPAWQMSLGGGTQASMTSQVWYDVKFNTVDLDTDSGCDTTAKTYTIPAGKGGKYMVGVRVFTGNNSGGYGYTLLNDSEIKLRKNPAGADTLLMSVWMDWRNNPVRRGPLVGNIMLDLTAGDVLYVEVRNHIVTAGNYGVVIEGTGSNVFYGFKLLGV